MTYEDAINFLYNATPQFQKIGAAAYKPGLDTTHILDDAFGNCHRAFKSVHVAGTNGKGSTSHTIASVLQEQGYKVGLYTSPHLIDFRERIRVNGEKISKDAVIDFINRYNSKHLDLSPSFFELTTIMAFDYFKSQNVDYAVIEVGLGGRLDCTNIITPILSVITNISKDHIAQLGNTLDSIAKEKAGIIKISVPVVIGEAEGNIKTIFEQTAKEKNTEITFAQENNSIIKCIEDKDNSLLYNTAFGRISSPLTGSYQKPNMLTILTAIKKLRDIGINISNESILHGCENVIANTHLMGRWLTLSKNPTVIADTGHNIGGWKYLSKQLSDIAKKQRLFIIIGFVSDKDVNAIFELVPHNAKYIFTRASVPRAMDTNTLYGIANSHGLSGLLTSNVTEAIELAKKTANDNDVIFIGGSTFVVADALSYFDSLIK